MIRALIFDCFGVLYQGSLEYLLATCPPKHRQQLTDLSHASDRGFVTASEYISQASVILDVSEEALQVMISQRHVRNDALLHEVKRLRGTYKTAMLSNIGPDVIPSLFGVDELAELFDQVVLSSDVGAAKPDVVIYRETAARLGVQPHECVMIDDLQMNVDGAIRAGMTSIRYVSNDELVTRLDSLSA